MSSNQPRTAAEHASPEPGTEDPATPDPGQQNGYRAQDSCHRSRFGGRRVTAINGNQKVANVTEIGRGMGVEVTERDHDEEQGTE